MEKPTITFSGSRGEEWVQVLGARTFAIRSPHPEACQLEGSPDELCVFLDLDELGERKVDALAIHMAQRLGGTPRETKAAILQMGVSIRLGSDTHIDIPPGYAGPTRAAGLRCGPNAFAQQRQEIKP